ncbi:MAG: N-acetyltransferase family protein [Pyrinomonadaceae bacterium]
MDYQIRQIGPDDLEVVVALIREFAEHEDLSDYCEVTVGRLDAAMFGENAMVEGLIVFAGGTPVGYALFVPTFSSFRGQRALYLDDLYVNEGHRGKGIGRTLLKKIASIAADRGFERIDFLVLDDNERAKAFYRSLGAVCNPRDRHFKFTDEAFRRLSE